MSAIDAGAVRLRQRWYLLALALILVLGAALRLYGLNTLPTELVVDEIDLYNSARSIATTGHDVDGTLMPFLYSKFTRNPPIYAFAGYASSLVFGKTPFGLRFPAVIFGLLSIVFLAGIAYELTRRRTVALAAALLMATQPIFIQFSRTAWEPSCELPFLLAGLYVLLRALRRASQTNDPGRALSPGGLALGAVLLGLTSYTYMAGWFYSLLLGATLLAFYVWRWRSVEAWIKVAGALALWFVVSAPALWMCFFDPSTIGRAQRISTFANGVSLSALQAFASNYASHFRWSYLVTTGDPIPGATWRYLNGFGAFFWWTVAFAVLGLGYCADYARKRGMALWLGFWVLLYPVGGAVTNDGAPNAPRTLAGAPIFCLLAAIGIAVLFDWAASLRAQTLRRVAVSAARAFVAAIACVSVALFAQFYFTQYVHRNSNAWDSGTRAMFAFVRDRSTQYDRVCFNVRSAWYGIHPYVRFYLEGDPIQTFDNVDDPACMLPGTMLAIDMDHLATYPHFAELTEIQDIDGNGFVEVFGRPRGGK